MKTNHDVNEKNIPQELKGYHRWVTWKWEERNGKRTKPPYDFRTGRKADKTDKAAWATFADVLQAYPLGYSGIGFCFSESDPFCGIDLDDCLNPETGRLEPWAENIVSEFDSYTEVSPSGTGVKIFCKGKLPAGGRRKGKLELYDKDAYFTVTGELYGTQTEIKDCQVCIDELLRKMDSGSSQKPSSLSDQEIIDKMLESRSGAAIQRLLAGDFSEYPSQSEADQALCNHLAFWTGCNAGQMDSIFRTSGLMRDKWDVKHHADGRTYGDATIQTAISGCSDTYRKPKTQTKVKEAWPEPEPIRTELLPVEELRESMIPEPLLPMCQDIAYRMSVPLDFIAVPLIVVIGSVIGTGCRIKPKRKDDWSITPNLWAALIGNPSVLKSPALDEVIKRTLGRLEAEENEKFKHCQKEFSLKAEAARLSKDVLKSEYKQVLKKERK